MFTGIVEEIGRVEEVAPRENGVLLRIAATDVLGDLARGSSVAVQGVCLTVLDLAARGFAVAAESETLRLTTLAGLRVGTRVNLERALVAGGRLDGHLVQGHVDGTCRVAGVRAEGRTRVLEIELPPDLAPYVVPKGSVALDGVSLTVGPRVREARFEVFLIPYTWEKTTLGGLGAGDRVNVETDLVARTVVHWLESAAGQPQSGLTMEALERAFGRGGTA